MRLLVGCAFQAVMQDHADLRKRWYRVGKREMAVYEALRVKRWKRKMPTYDNALFDPRPAYMGRDRSGYVPGGAGP